MHDRQLAWRVPLSVMVIFLAAGGIVSDDVGAQDIEALESRFTALYGDSRFAEAEAVARQILSASRNYNQGVQAYGHYYLGLALSGQSRYSEAEPHYNEAARLADRSVSSNSAEAAYARAELGRLYLATGRYDHAEQFLSWAAKTLRRVEGADSLDAATAEQNLGLVRMLRGEFADAELIFKRLLNHPNANDGYRALIYRSLAAVYAYERRYAEAVAYGRAAVELGERALADELELATSRWMLGTIYSRMDRFDEARDLFSESLPVVRRKLGDYHHYSLEHIYDVAAMARRNGQLDEAIPLLEHVVEAATNSIGDTSPLLTWPLNDLALAHFARGEVDEARNYARQSLAFSERGTHSLQVHRARVLLATMAWQEGEHDEAIELLEAALQDAESQRVQIRGAAYIRAESATPFLEAFALMVGWQNELGNVERAFAALEHNRARALIEQMSLRGVSLLAGLPPDEAARFAERQRAATALVTQYETELRLLDERSDLSDEARQAQRKSLFEKLRAAQHEFATVYSEMRSASPAVRLALGQDQEPASLDALVQWAKANDALVLQYLLSSEANELHRESYVLMITPSGEVSIEPLVMDEENGDKLNLTDGLVTEETLRYVLAGDPDDDDDRGVLASLRLPTDEPAIDALAALYQVLLPAQARALLEEEQVQQVLVVPDGSLAALPFECLVIDGRPEPRYLIDQPAPIVYTPSATLFLNLVDESKAPRDAEAISVLSLGNPQYASAAPQQAAQASADNSVRAGRLAPLPFTEFESQWVARVFTQRGHKAELLLDARATEKNFRDLSNDRTVLHLACHGLTEQSHGNLLGSLALTPGTASAGPADDGNLTLAEIYELDLQPCQLAILSACETNLGPQQRGEAVWAISRGFLVAGADRVLASNWVVDDKGAASLISYFTAGVADQLQKEGTADYSNALHAAKQWLRQQAKWKHPFYWASFVLVGPP